MNDRRRLLAYSVVIVALVALASTAGAAYQFHRLAQSPAADAGEGFAVAMSLAVGTALVITFAGGTLLLRAANPFIARLQASQSQLRRSVEMLQLMKLQLEAKVAELLRINSELYASSDPTDSSATEALEQLQRAHHDLDHFVRALSHDMNANFMVLESSFHELRSSCGASPSAGLTDGLAHLEACLHESKRFLDDLITLAKTGSVHLEPQAVELGQVVKEVLFEQQELLLGRGVQVEVDPGLPQVWCNESRVKQVLTNLVRNAVRHGCDARFPRITIGRCGERSDAAFQWIAVHDNGRGIPAAARDEVFLPGRRLAGAHPQGSGMGLAIVKKIVDHYGGHVYLDPACDSGTRFIFSLPKAIADAPRPLRGPTGRRRVRVR